MNPEHDPAEADNVPSATLPAADLAAAPSIDGTSPDTAAKPGAEAPVAVEGAPAMPDAAPAAHIAKTAELSPAACGTRLAALFPALFVGPDGKGTWKAIKLRIHADIQARAPGEFSKRTLGIFFSRYTTTTAYLKALSTAAQRFDLDGQPAGEIAAEHRQAATEELARRHALAAERRAAQRPPPRQLAPAGQSDISPGAEGEARPERQPGPRPDVRAQRQDDVRPATRRPQRPPADGQRPDRADEHNPGAPPSSPSARPPRPPRRTDRPPHPPRPQHPEQLLPTQGAESAAALPADPAQRERVMLVRSYESSPLSKANFCTLKGVSEALLDAALAQVQAERGVPSSAPPRRTSNRR